VNVRKAGTTDRYGASRNTRGSAASGRRSSLKISLMPSANVWSRPQGPARFGPMRFWKSAMSLRSNQIMKITPTITNVKPSSAFSSTMSTTPRSNPWR
jgi:hypothetical protein